MKKILLGLSLIFSLVVNGQILSMPANGWRYTAYVRQNLELDWSVEQSSPDPATYTEIVSVPPAANYWQALEKQTGYTSTARVNTYAREGTWSCQVNLDKNFPLDDRWRTEFVFFSDITSQAERWYGFSIYLPSDYESDSDLEEIVQWHGANDVCDGPKISPVGLYIASDAYDLNIAYNATACSSSWTDHHVNLGSSTGDYGKWTDFVFRIVWDYAPGGNGFIEVWKDGVSVYSNFEQIGYNDAQGPYQKAGLHRPGYPGHWPGGWPSTKTAYYDAFRISSTSGSGGYNDVKPGND